MRREALATLVRTGVMAILDDAVVPPAAMGRLARSLARGGVRVFQVRIKAARDRVVLDAIRSVRRAARGGIVLLNDRCDLAVAAGAAGVHLGTDDLPAAAARRLIGPDRLLGLSAGTLAEVRRAVRGRPDYVSLGPAFRTRTKRDAGPPLGPAGVRRLARGVPSRLPVLAVGGINSHNGGTLMVAGVAAVAVASWWPRSERAARAAREMLAAIQNAKQAARRPRRTTGTW